MSFKKIEEMEDDIFLRSEVAQITYNKRRLTVAEIVARANALKLTVERTEKEFQDDPSDMEKAIDRSIAIFQYQEYMSRRL